jgi:hypothetical protein
VGRSYDRNIEEYCTLRAKRKEGPGESDRSPRSGNSCVRWYQSGRS